MKYENFALLIQGPLNEISLNYLDQYVNEFDDVIISCWDSDSICIKHGLLDKIKLIKNKPWVEFQQHSPRMQMQTVWAGLMQCKTKYVIKMRADEYFTDFIYMRDMIRNNPFKLFTLNHWFGFDPAGKGEQCTSEKYAVKFSPCDHLWGGRTDQLIAMTEMMKLMIAKGREHQARKLDLPMSDVDRKSFEALMAFCFISVQGEAPKRADSINQMQRYFGIIPLERMGKFHIHHNNANKQYNNIEEYKRDRKFDLQYIDMIAGSE